MHTSRGEIEIKLKKDRDNGSPKDVNEFFFIIVVVVAFSKRRDKLAFSMADFNFMFLQDSPLPSVISASHCSLLRLVVHKI